MKTLMLGHLRGPEVDCRRRSNRAATHSGDAAKPDPSCLPLPLVPISHHEPDPLMNGSGRMKQDVTPIKVVPANQSSCSDLQAVFGDRGTASSCQCQRFKT